MSPFGMLMPNRTYSAQNSYRYGFNAQEQDREINKDGNVNGAEFWEYDSRIGRRWNIDPKPNTGISVYSTFANNPIMFTDHQGDTTSPSWTSKLMSLALRLATGEFQKNVADGGTSAVKDAIVGTYDFVRRDAWKSETYSNLLQFGMTVGSYGQSNPAMFRFSMDATFGSSTQDIHTSLGQRFDLSKWNERDWSYNLTSAGIMIFGPKVAKGVGSNLPNLVTKEGFLIGSVNIKAPFNIQVQRFGSSMSLTSEQAWGINVGSNKFVARTFFAIKPEWNDLSVFTTGVIPKGTSMKVGIVGPQGWTRPGGLIQFNVKSSQIKNQTTKFTLNSGYPYKGNDILRLGK